MDIPFLIEVLNNYLTINGDLLEDPEYRDHFVKVEEQLEVLKQIK